jgi:phenylalanyl-tRNA synthetase beta chain
MLVSYEWLSEYVDLEGISPEDIAEELNRTGIEVEVIYTRDAGVSRVVVGKVLQCIPHPEADRLNVCSVHVGLAVPLQIVCGAKNVAAGQLVPVALEGATLPGDIKIKRTKLRGVESNGMICSAKELGLPDKVLMKEQQEGILVLGKDARIGQDIKQYLGMNDQAIELQLTPNRSDCLSMFGVAYEISAIFNRELRLPEVEVEESPEQLMPLSISLQNEEDCPIYAAQVVHDLRIGPSPQWMQNRLITAGIRPINNIVDITNYVMVETGQPLHAYDYEQVHGGQIVVRRAVEGEQLVTLDGVTRTLDDETLIITDGQEILGLAGIMGGESSEVKPVTTTILLESAYFDPHKIRSSSRKLGIRSEANHRFERGVNPERVQPALARAVQLLRELAYGEVASEVVVAGLEEVEDIEVTLRHDRLTTVMGIELEEAEVLSIFERLQFPVTVEEGVYRVKAPVRRPDINIEVDLIEEVARLYGYDRIPTSLPWGQQQPGGRTEWQENRRTIRHTLRDLGLNEVITYSLTSESLEGEITYPLTVPHIPIPIAMPMSNEHAILRTNLLPQLVQVAAHNRNHGVPNISIYELSKVYLASDDNQHTLPEERFQLAFLLTGDYHPSSWIQAPQKGGDFFTAKGLLTTLLERLCITGMEYEAISIDGFHPGRTALLKYDKHVIGVLGQLHPSLSKKYDLDDTVVCQLDLENLLQLSSKDDLIYQPIPRYPGITRDLALIIDESLPVSQIEAGIRAVTGELLKKVTLFDVFTGEQIGTGKKSIAFNLVYRSDDRTLTDEEVQSVHDGAVAFLVDTFKAKLR